MEDPESISAAVRKSGIELLVEGMRSIITKTLDAEAPGWRERPEAQSVAGVMAAVARVYPKYADDNLFKSIGPSVVGVLLTEACIDRDEVLKRRRAKNDAPIRDANSDVNESLAPNSSTAPWISYSVTNNG